MAVTVESYVAGLTDAKRRVIIEGYEQLRKTGMIGDEPIRTHAEKLMDIWGVKLSVVMIMNDLALECFRHFTNRYFDEHPS